MKEGCLDSSWSFRISISSCLLNRVSIQILVIKDTRIVHCSSYNAGREFVIDFRPTGY